MIKKLLMICCFFIASLSVLQGVIIEMKDLNKLEEETQKLCNNDLGLFDIDYTILSPKDVSLKSCGKGLRRQFLNVLDIKRKEYLLSITALEGEEELMDSAFPSLIQQLQKNNIPVIGLTALETGEFGKISHLEDWRIQQLRKFNIDFSSAFHDYNPLVLTESNQRNGRYPVFKNGVLFTNDQPKGPILADFLRKIRWKPKKILFMDDSMEQLKSVESAAQLLGIEFVGFHYIVNIESKAQFDQTIGELQFKNLVENEHWLTDDEAKKFSKNRIMIFKN